MHFCLWPFQVVRNATRIHPKPPAKQRYLPDGQACPFHIRSPTKRGHTELDEREILFAQFLSQQHGGRLAHRPISKSGQSLQAPPDLAAESQADDLRPCRRGTTQETGVVFHVPRPALQAPGGFLLGDLPRDEQSEDAKRVGRLPKPSRLSRSSGRRTHSGPPPCGPTEPDPVVAGGSAACVIFNYTFVQLSTL